MGGRRGGQCLFDCVSWANFQILIYDAVPGCSVESMIFFAVHSSLFISLIFPCLYAETSCLAFSRPALVVNNVLYS